MSFYDYDPEDDKELERLINVAGANGWHLSKKLAGLIWRDHSDDWCASWLILPERDEEIWRYLKEYV